MPKRGAAASTEAEAQVKRARATKAEAADAVTSPAAPTGQDHTAPEWVPRNAQVPSGPLTFEPPADGCRRVLIWNITSLKSSDNKGLMKYLQAENADIAVLSETKVNQVPSHAGIDAMYKYRYWGIGEKRGYAGIALLSKHKPLKVEHGLPGFDDPSSKARLLMAEFEHTVIVGTYAVNAGDNLKTLPNKNKWNDALEAYLQSLPKDKDIIWCGDLNVVWDDRDLAGASKKWNKSAGYTQAECDAHRRVLATNDMSDAWRVLHPDAVGHYTYYGWRGNCRARGAGWRIDSFIVRTLEDTLTQVSNKALPRIRACEIRHAIYGASDHLPVVRTRRSTNDPYQIADIQGPW
ncbi:double-stranded DNA 3'-5' DNA exonuclease [Malassezia pachydermatis]